MRAVLQRVRSASVAVGGVQIAAIGEGALALLGVAVGDSVADAERFAAKIAGLRIFPDDAGVMNRSVIEHGGEVLSVSQFTLYGDASRGRRPSYVQAAPGEEAEPIYRMFCEALRSHGLRVAEGVFGADMDVALVNWGPVTILL